MATPAYEVTSHVGGADDWAAITPNDTTVLSPRPRALYIGTAGDLALVGKDGGAAVVFQNVPVGVLQVRPTKVMATDTAASDIVAMY